MSAYFFLVTTVKWNRWSYELSWESHMFSPAQINWQPRYSKKSLKAYNLEGDNALIIIYGRVIIHGGRSQIIYRGCKNFSWSHLHLLKKLDLINDKCCTIVKCQPYLHNTLFFMLVITHIYSPSNNNTIFLLTL